MFNAIVTASTLALMATQSAAQANRYCAPRDSVVQRLAENYGESRQSIGLGQQGTMIETFASSDTGTWTILSTNPRGISCIEAAGYSFEVFVAEAPQPSGDRI